MAKVEDSYSTEFYSDSEGKVLHFKDAFWHLAVLTQIPKDSIVAKTFTKGNTVRLQL